jgi:hypothetical protein
MGFFRRDKEPPVSINYKHGPKGAIVTTSTGRRLLQDVVNEGWVSIAGLAWWGYRQYGLGLVKFNAETGEMGYIDVETLAESIAGTPDGPDILATVESYYPDTQVVLLTQVVSPRVFSRSPEDLVAILTTPKGGTPPVGAWAMMERLEELRQINAAIRSRVLGDDRR